MSEDTEKEKADILMEKFSKAKLWAKDKELHYETKVSILDQIDDQEGGEVTISASQAIFLMECAGQCEFHDSLRPW